MEYNFPIFNMKDFMAEQDLLDVSNTLERSAREIRYDRSCEALVRDIQDKIYEIKESGFHPDFILLNKNNYEKLIAWRVHMTGDSSAPDDFMGCRLVLWEVPIDYVNVRARASDEWANEGAIKRKKEM